MKILYHHRTQGTGGEGVHIREWITAFRALGHDVDIVSPPGVDPMRTSGNPALRPVSFKGQCLRFLSRHAPQLLFECMELAYNLYASMRVSRCLRAARYDMVYERYAFFCFGAVRAASKRGVPVVLEVNEVSGIERVRGQCLGKLSGAVEKKVFREATVLCVVSSFLKEALVQRGVASEKILVVPNAINLEGFTAVESKGVVRERHHFGGKTLLGFAGTLAPWDRLDRLILNFKKLQTAHPETHLVLMGQGRVLDALQLLVTELHLERHVTFTGNLSRDKMPGYIGALDVALLPHSNPFGSPLVMFEYMAMERPIVAVSVPPVRDVLTDGETALLFAPGDDAGFLGQVEKVLSDPELGARLGANARRQVESRHTWTANAARIEAFFHTRMQEERSPS